MTDYTIIESEFLPSVVVAAVELLRSMEELERMQVFDHFCYHCGANRSTADCTCWKED